MNERDARAAIVEYGARLWNRHLVSGSSGNVSVRIDGGDLLVTPAGRSLGSLAAHDVVRVDADGNPRDPALRATSELPLHLAAYGVRSDVRCVVHTHPTFCVVWSLWGELFPKQTVGAAESLGPVAWTAFHPAGSRELAAVCAREFERGIDIVLMERHGLSSVGTDLETAFVRTDQAEEAARTAYFASLRALNSGKNKGASEIGGPL